MYSAFMKWTELTNDICPVARTMSLVGDRWTILIIRDCFLGLSRFDQFQKSTGMTRHVLSNRLKRLTDGGILIKRAVETGRARHEYVLTDKGRELGPALSILRDWGKSHIPVRRTAGA